MADTDLGIDELVEDMTLASALHVKYLAMQGVYAAKQDTVSESIASLKAKQNSDLGKAQATYDKRVEAVNAAFTEAIEKQDAILKDAIQATSDAQHVLVAQQELILEKHGAKVDLLDARRGGGGILHV